MVFWMNTTLRTYSNTRCMVFRMDTTVLAPTPSPWYSIDSLGANSLFLGPNYPMMVKGDPAAVDTTLLPFMRNNCIYTSDIAVVPYPAPDIRDGYYCAWYSGWILLSGPIPTPVAWYSGWILVC